MYRNLARIAVAVVITLTATSAAAQQKEHEGKKGEKHDMAGMMQHEKSPWKEMDVFHATLGTSFHPVEKGDFAPLKANAESLAAKARSWNTSTAPAACATPAMKESVAWLATNSAALAAKVKSGAADSELKAAITAIHDRFEVAEKGCAEPNDMKGMKH
ncbi:MAG: hypothetical protein IT360_21955 [Gemmatimonadaceae bacterium]|nr:hypothetical protein [Gemmatimonadaceae bacterium]